MAQILVIDDDVELAAMVHEWLIEADHSVKVAHNGADGLQALEEGAYDLVICDWHMPGMQGIDVLNQFRKMNAATPVLMLTSNSQIDAKEAAFDGGANDYLTKPFNLRELSARVKTILRNRPSQTDSLKPLGTNNTAVLAKADLAGTQLAAKYEFLEILGEGAWGVVFKAHHPLLDKLVAIKMLLPLQVTDGLVESFQLEGQAISRLDHKNIVTVHDFGITERRQPFMVMEYLNGQNLHETLKKFSAAPWDVALNIMVQVCDGVAHAHSAGVIHGDLKPANIVLKRSANGPLTAKILDFGLARFTGEEESSAPDAERKIAGSPIYMAPELLEKFPPDQLTDVYALGCIFFQMLAGTDPFAGTSINELLENIIVGSKRPLAQFRPDLQNPSIQAVIDQAMSKERSQRFQTATQFKEALLSLALARTNK